MWFEWGWSWGRKLAWVVGPDGLENLLGKTHAQIITGIGKTEASRVKAAYEDLFTRMAPTQQVLLVPGTFGCSNLSTVGKAVNVSRQEVEVLAKIDVLYEWAQAETRVGGFMPWHWTSRGGDPSGGAPCDMAIGAESMPKVAARLREVGSAIVKAQAH